ncbi:MAG TPA: hypothetical protein VMU36_07305 [Spirochaetia bacterium]|nr:hypothetical protein [Spirochaetia bacterium]
MTPGAPSGAIQISLRPGLRLRPGEVVVLTVIKRLDAGKWAVGIGGRVYPAFSQLALDPGAILKARVSTSAGRLLLSLTHQPLDVIRAALVREGVPGGAESLTIARALVLAGLPIRAETIEKVRARLSGLRLAPHRGARLIATLIDKGIDPASRGVEALLGLLTFGERSGADPRRFRGKPLPTSAHAMKEIVSGLAASAPESADAIQAFNHMRGRSQTWVVVPFAFDDGPQRLCGTIRILFDPFLSRPLRMALSVGEISFFLPLEGKKRKLSVFVDDPALEGAARRGLDRLRSKFHNMGMEVDDTVLGGDAFDGFSPTAEGASLPIIDVAG